MEQGVEMYINFLVQLFAQTFAMELFFFQLMTNHHIILILVLVLFLSQLDQRLSIQSLQLRLKSANKEKNCLYFINYYSTCLLVLEKAICNKNLIKCFASIHLVLLII